MSEISFQLQKVEKVLCCFCFESYLVCVLLASPAMNTINLNLFFQKHLAVCFCSSYPAGYLQNMYNLACLKS